MVLSKQSLRATVYGIFFVLFISYSGSIAAFPGIREYSSATKTTKTMTAKLPEQNTEQRDNKNCTIAIGGLIVGGLIGFALCPTQAVLGCSYFSAIGGLSGCVLGLMKDLYDQDMIIKKQKQVLTKTLYKAVLNNDRTLEDVKELVQAGANVHCTSRTGENLLSLYVLQNHSKSFFNKSIMQFLIDKGVNPCQQNNAGDTVFHCAASQNYPWSFMGLLKRKDALKDKHTIINILSAKKRKAGLFGAVPKPVIKMIFEYFLERRITYVYDSKPFTIVTDYALHGIKNNKGETVFDILQKKEKF